MRKRNSLIPLSILFVVAVLLLSAISCTRYEEVRPGTPAKYEIGDKLRLNGITIPESNPPFTVTAEYYDKSYWEWAYNATDANGREWLHLMQYQLKR